MALSKEDQFPQGVQFSYVPIDLKDLTLLNPLACGRPIQLKVDEVLLKIDGKGLVLVGAPGAFTRMYYQSIQLEVGLIT